MIRSTFTCCKYVVNPYVNLLKTSKNLVSKKKKKCCTRPQKRWHTAVKNYCPISVLSIFRKIFKRLLYNSMFEFFMENTLISPNQWGDSCINQLLPITHEIYKSFDDISEVRGVFLVVSKAFDKMWRSDLIYKLKQNCIAENLLNILTDF